MDPERRDERRGERYGEGRDEGRADEVEAMEGIVAADEGPVRVLTLDRPEVRNALSSGLRRSLLAALDAAERDEGVRAVVLTGAGDAFCAGLDLRELERIAERSTEENRADSRALADLFERLATFPKPTVAAVNGPAVAGGAGLVAACDLAVMAEGARLGYTEARIGFVAALVGVLLVRQVGGKAARDLLLTARLVDAEEARAMGLVNEVVADGAARGRAVEVARRMAGNAPSSLAMTKALLASLPAMSLGDGMRAAVEVNALARTTSELKEGVRAFLEKRPPAWKR